MAGTPSGERRASNGPLLWVLPLLVAAVFVADALTPHGLDVPLLYLLPIALTSRAKAPRLPILVSAVCTLLAGVAFLVKRPEVALPLSGMDRIAVAGVTWVLAMSIVRSIRAGRALRERAAHFRAIVEQTGDGIFFVDDKGTCTDANASGCAMLGYAREELLRMNAAEVIVAEERARIVPELLQVMQGLAYEREWRFLRKDGSTFPGAVHAFLLPDGRIVGIVRDITARRRSEESVREMSRRLMQAQEEAQRHFARELHDSTAQKLTALGMTLSLLSARLEDATPDVRQRLEGAETLARDCAKEVRTLAHLLHPPLLEEMGIGPALAGYIEGFARQSGIEVAFSPPPDLGRFPRDVELCLFRVAQEALSNVHRHSGSRTARVECVRAGERIILEVQDRGRGIPAERLQAFGERAPSVGLGLFGMIERVRQIGGELEVDSSPSGTTVRAILPAGKEER